MPLLALPLEPADHLKQTLLSTQEFAPPSPHFSNDAPPHPQPQFNAHLAPPVPTQPQRFGEPAKKPRLAHLEPSHGTSWKT